MIDYLKRRLLFWKYTKVIVSLEDDDIIFIKKSAKQKKISIDQFIEICLENHLRNIK